MSRRFPPRLSHRTRIALLVPLFLGLIVASLFPGAGPSPEHGIDLGVHTLVYAFMTATTAFLVGHPVRSAIALFALSVALEFAQELVPGRDGSLSDVIANAGGVLFGLGIVGLASMHPRLRAFMGRL